MIIGNVPGYKRVWHQNHIYFPLADSGSSQIRSVSAQETAG